MAALVVDFPRLKGILEFQPGLIHFRQQFTGQPIQRRNQTFVRQAVTSRRAILRRDGFKQADVSIRQAIDLGLKQPRLSARFIGQVFDSQSLCKALIGVRIAQREHSFQKNFLIFFGKEFQAAVDVLGKQSFRAARKLVIADGDCLAYLPFVQFGQHQQANAYIHRRDLAVDGSGFDQILDDVLFDGFLQVGFVYQLADHLARLIGGEESQRYIQRRASAPLQFRADEIHPIRAELTPERDHPGDAVRRSGFANDAAQQLEYLPAAAQLFKLVQHNDMQLTSERIGRIDQFAQRFRFRSAFRPFFLNGSQQSLVRFGRHRLPVMEFHVFAVRAVVQNMFQPRAEQRGFPGARSAPDHDQRDLIIQYQAQQLSQFVFASQLTKQLAVGFGECHRPFDRCWAIFHGQ